ncbi:hypothetical protein C8A03DRAFT_41911 [Achaetomium macrosporum]|uniref:Uncharacterized protein n=1 Tax=Achaetomium macrosporum TaxID=79813 RepID=A0AAN7CEI3_9PEZI|nr:hypothetical protein C8A03DRAFT_41911 [Achaetomium macrosporum]
MQDDPPCDWADFLSPKLRRLPPESDNIRLRRFLGHGIEGCVAEVHFLTRCRPRADGGHWSVRLGLLRFSKKFQTGLRQSSPNAIQVPVRRMARLDCLRSLYAFSAEGRRARHFDTLPSGEKVSVSESSTRVRQCFGWTTVAGKDFQRLNKKIEVNYERDEATASYPAKDRKYFAIIYEYIPHAELELKAVQRQLDFFHHIGFQQCQDPTERNWEGPGMLLDFGDYSSPVDKWLDGGSAYRPPVSARVVVDWATVQKEATEKWNRIHELRISGVGPTAGEKLEDEKERVREDTATYIERGYRKNRLYPGYFELSPEEISSEGLLEDPLCHIQIPEIEPRVLRKAWKRYEKEKDDYLSQSSPALKSQQDSQVGCN